MTESADYSSLAQALADLDAKDNRRRLTLLERREGNYAWIAGRRLLNVSSNDYLGLATDPQLQSAFFKQCALDRFDDAFGLSASSSRLLTGNHAEYASVETKLAAMFGREAALVLNSGYHANLGLLPALVGPEDVVFSDRLNHASLIDGVRLSGAKLFRYPHLDYAHLEHLLAKHRNQARRAVIVSESVFSMDGDCADLRRLAALKRQYASWLYVDEAHAFGVFGDRGLGLAETQGVIPDIDLLVGTFGKALAALGAYVVADRIVVDYLINTTRPFIFTTALPPVILHWLSGLLDRLPEWRAKRGQVLALAQQLRAACTERGLAVRGESQIVPIIIGDNERTLKSARALKEAGFLLMAVRPPTVPTGTSRLRVSLSAAMDWEELKALPGCIIKSLAE
jgi:8-amino-7-oxononanoate synthase